jgi:sugar-specific transcriptional regulator TrmB
MIMSRKRVIEALSSLGLELKDIEVYIFLAREGPQEANSIANGLRIFGLELTNSLELLKKKGIIKIIDKITPEQFLAVSFEKVVNQLVEANLKTAEFTEKNKKIILRNWKSIL